MRTASSGDRSTVRAGWLTEASLPRPIAEALRPLALWAVVLGGGVTLLYGRYDWGLEDGRFAERGFVLSTYLFLILLPTCFYLARYLLRNFAVAVALTACVFIITTLPYELIGLDRFYYYATRPHYFTISQFPPSLQFLPGGRIRTFPFDWLFMPLLFAIGAGIVWFVWWIRGRSGLRAARAIPVLLTAAFAAICVQSFFHSSMRAPYTYLAYFQRPEAEQHWYHVYHFADGSGATEGDQFTFSPLEDYFQGAPRDGNNMLLRRPFSFYLASQASYFVNTFYVWLALNALFWLAAVFATGRLVAQLTTQRAGVIAGALTAVGPGFVAFVATPGMYLQHYAAVAIALCLFHDFVVRPGGRDLGRVATFTGVLALCGLVYDLTPLLPVLLAYGLVSRVRVWPLFASLGAAFLAVRAFPLLATDVLGIEINPTNQVQIDLAIDRTKAFLLHPSLGEWYDAAVSIIPSYLHLLLQAFFVVPLVIALLGLWKLRGRPLQVLVGGLLAMGLATTAIFQIGEQELGWFPRFVYPVFPAVYLLAALALDLGGRAPRSARQSLSRRAMAVLRIAAPWAVVAVMAVLANIDIFGYPTLYVEYLVSEPPAFVPH